MMNYETFKRKWEEYKNSVAWQRLKQELINKHGNVCYYDVDHQYPPHEEPLEMHHIRYPEYPFEKNDNIDNVILLCRSCHEDESFSEGVDGCEGVEERFSRDD